MKHYALGLIAAVAFLFAGCDKDENKANEVELTLTFKALYDGQRLVKNTDYNYNDYKVQFSRFTTYLSDIKLLTGNEEILVKDIAYLDFTPDGSPNDQSVDVTIKATVPEGNYTGLKIGYGVNPTNNAKAPSDFSAGSPLASEAEYWGGWKSYIFTKIEGQGDGNNDGNQDIFMIFHCGSDKVYREYSYEKAITVAGSSALTVEFDLKNMFYTNSQWYDMTIDDNQFTSNNKNDVRVATILMDNFDNATTVKQ